MLRKYIIQLTKKNKNNKASCDPENLEQAQIIIVYGVLC